MKVPIFEADLKNFNYKYPCYCQDDHNIHNTYIYYFKINIYLNFFIFLKLISIPIIAVVYINE